MGEFRKVIIDGEEFVVDVDVAAKQEQRVRADHCIVSYEDFCRLDALAVHDPSAFVLSTVEIHRRRM